MYHHVTGITPGAREAHLEKEQTMPEVHAIPTVYKGIEFRSRLEAKWAIMFDYLDWPWQYEPVDFKGYIPDFHIDFGRQQFFVEIKPAFTQEDLRPALDKAVRALGHSRKETILVLGGTPGEMIHGSSGHPVWGLNALMDQSCYCDLHDAYLAGCPTCNRIVPLTIDGQWGFPCCEVPKHDDEHEIKHYRHEIPPIGSIIETYWARATNVVKYQHGRR